MIISVIILTLPVCSFSKSIWFDSANIGYWFYKEPVLQNTNRVNKKDTQNCLNSIKWTVDCGFIDPTKLRLNKEETFLFEQKEYKALLHNFSMGPNDHHAVLQWQKFNDWAIGQAMTAAYSSEFNIAQHPELDSTIAHPFSQFANLIMKNVDDVMREDFFNMLSKTSILVFFTRSNCNFCHHQADIIHILEEKTHIPVWNASLDTNYLPNFNRHLLAPTTLLPAKYLHISTVPTLFLYLAPQGGSNSQEHWIRLSTGLTSEDIIENRILQFSKNYRRGLLSAGK